MRYGPELIIGIVHFINGSYSEAIDAAKRSIQSGPNFGASHALLEASYVRKGEPVAAQDALRRLREIQPHFRIESFSEPYRVVADDIVEALREAGLPE